MQSFTTLSSVAAPLPEANLDTDIIFPARFLLLLDKAGLGKHLFHERRHPKLSGAEAFVLDRAPFDTAQILVAGPNFGSGSSREQAVWALLDFGIRSVIAPSFGEIFYGNCFKNGVLPIVVSEEAHQRALRAAETGLPITVDLAAQTIALPTETVAFDIDPYRRQALLLGLDEIDGILANDQAEIDAFEQRQRNRSPWLYLDDERREIFAGLSHARETKEGPA
jgi:3-isopropylmalate/(R)-2-methylmalate dehydratase small subunit